MIIGGSMSSGSRRSTDETRSRTSCAATSMSRLRLNVTFSIDWPGADTERSSLMPSTRLTTSSRTSESWLSTSSTEPPGRVVRTITFGRSTDGNRSTPSRMNDAPPTTTSAMTSIVAKTGRRMQMAARAAHDYSRDGDGRAVGQPARRDDHHITRLDAVDELDAIAGADTGPHALLVGLAVLDDQHLLDAGKDDERRLRDDQRRLFLGDDVGLREGAWPELAVDIRNLRLDRQGARAFGNRRADARDAPFVRGRIAFDGDAHALADPQHRRGPFGDGQLQSQRMLPYDRGNRRAGSAVLAGEHEAFAHDAVDRRAQGRVVQLLAGERHFGSALRQHGLAVAHFLERVLMAAFGDFQRGVGGFEIGLGGDAALDEGGDALALAARFVHARPAPGARGRSDRRRPCRFRRSDRGRGGRAPAASAASAWRRRSSKSVGVKPRDQVALAHGRSQVDAQVLDTSGDLEAEGDLFLGGERAAHGHAAGDRLLLEAYDFDGSGGRRGRRYATPPTRRRHRPPRSTRLMTASQDDSRTHNATCSPVAARTTSASRLWRQ